MSEVDQLLDAATTRFDRLEEISEKAVEEYKRIDSLFGLLADMYDEEVHGLRREVEELEERIEDVDRRSKQVAAQIPKTARQDEFNDIKAVVDGADFPDGITRDELARRLY